MSKEHNGCESAPPASYADPLPPAAPARRLAIVVLALCAAIGSAACGSRQEAGEDHPEEETADEEHATESPVIDDTPETDGSGEPPSAAPEESASDEGSGAAATQPMSDENDVEGSGTTPADRLRNIRVNPGGSERDRLDLISAQDPRRPSAVTAPTAVDVGRGGGVEPLEVDALRRSSERLCEEIEGALDEAGVPSSEEQARALLRRGLPTALADSTGEAAAIWRSVAVDPVETYWTRLREAFGDAGVRYECAPHADVVSAAAPVDR